MMDYVDPATLEFQAALDDLEDKGWSRARDGNSLSKQFKFKSFVEAIGWMVQCALYAERQNHHPEWFNVYNRVEVTLTTHSKKTVTSLDIKLAQKMDQLAGK